MMSDWTLDILFNIQTETRYMVKYPGYPPSNINTEIHSKKISVWFDLFKSDTVYLVKYSAEYKLSGQIFGIPSLKYTTVYPLKPNIRPDSEFSIGPDAVYKQVWISYRPHIQQAPDIEFDIQLDTRYPVKYLIVYKISVKYPGYPAPNIWQPNIHPSQISCRILKSVSGQLLYMEHSGYLTGHISSKPDIGFVVWLDTRYLVKYAAGFWISGNIKGL